MISTLIKTDFKTAQAYQGVRALRPDLIQHMALVVMQEEKPIGVLISDDITNEPKNLVIDCMKNRPSVTPANSVNEVLGIMKESRSDVLTVFNEGELVGLIYKDDLIAHISKNLEDKSNVVSNIVHDLRSPINSLTGLTAILKTTLVKEENKELIEQAEKACSYATEIINELLLVSQLESDYSDLNFEAVDIISLLEDCYAVASPSARNKKVNLVKRMPSSTLTITADVVKMQRAIFNLLSNALKFTPTGGTVKLSAEIMKNAVLISISDTGIGIPEEMQPIIFDKFTRAKRKGTSGEMSTGLGMYITRQIIEKHHGNLRFESETGNGSIFYIRLPAL